LSDISLKIKIKMFETEIDYHDKRLQTYENLGKIVIVSQTGNQLLLLTDKGYEITLYKIGNDEETE